MAKSLECEPKNYPYEGNFWKRMVQIGDFHWKWIRFKTFIKTVRPRPTPYHHLVKHAPGTYGPKTVRWEEKKPKNIQPTESEYMI